MVKRRPHKQLGFTLVEYLVVTLISGFLMLMVSSQLLDAHRIQLGNQSKAELVNEVKEIARKIANSKSQVTGATACTQIMTLNAAVNATFNPNAPTEVVLDLDPTVNTDQLLRQGTQVNGVAPFIINNLQLKNAALLASQGPLSIYTADLVMIAQTGAFGAMNVQRERQIATMTVTVSATAGTPGAIANCNVNANFSNPQAYCNAIDGMVWNPNLQKCQQDFYVPNVGLQFACPPGFQGTPGSCKLIGSTCASGQVARGYNKAQVSNCSQTPAGPARGPVSAPIPVAPVGVAASGPPPTLPPAPTIPTYIPPPVTTTVAAPSPPPTPPAACVNGTNLSQVTGSVCYPLSFSIDIFSGSIGSVCIPTAPAPPAASTNCVGTGTNSYTSPNLAVTPPSPAPPPDLSCQCNNRRIANGESCMYCIQDVDLGYGYVNYAYGVSTCTNGNLVPVPNPTANVGPGFVCGNNYGRARLVGGAYQMYNEIP
jgi:type II secretory pathway pseudopilin PulG